MGRMHGTLTERSRRLACGFLLVAASAVSASAQSTAADGWTTATVNSRVLGKRSLYVATPEGYRGGKSGYPGVVMLDADDGAQFRLWIAQAAYLAANSPGLPPVIIVGIANGSDRIHDMTPPAAGSSVKEYTTAGGADAFAAFILGEVLPQVRAHYRTVTTTILAGHSASGLFALDVASKKPEAFQGIIAMSPALWFNDSVLVDSYADLIGKSTTRPRMFVTSGGEEPNIDVPSKRCGRWRRSIRALRLPRISRCDAWVTSMSFADGLRFVFEPVASRHFAIEASIGRGRPGSRERYARSSEQAPWKRPGRCVHPSNCRSAHGPSWLPAPGKAARSRVPAHVRAYPNRSASRQPGGRIDRCGRQGRSAQTLTAVTVAQHGCGLNRDKRLELESR